MFLINLEKADKDVILVPLHNDLSEFDIERIINKRNAITVGNKSIKLCMMYL